LLVIELFPADIAGMNSNAVPHAGPKARLILVPLAAAAVLLACLGGAATAATPIGRDGQIHACYRVKGKPKGSLRVVPSAKKHCKRGERKVTWSVVGPSGQSGSGGQSGNGGQSGQAGTNGSSKETEAALQSKIANLNLKVEGLEGVLSGVTNGDLLGALNTLKGLDNGDLLNSVDAVKGLSNGDLSGAVDAVEGLTNLDLSKAVDAVQGLTNTDLTEAVDSLPVVDALCTQSAGLTEQVNDVAKGVSEIALGGILPGGLTLKLPTLQPLDPFTC
jgi:hypothetical protein